MGKEKKKKSLLHSQKRKEGL
jgi:hypothetical protein